MTELAGKLLQRYQQAETEFIWQIPEFLSILNREEFYLTSSKFNIMGSTWYLGVENLQKDDNGNTENWIFVCLERCDAGSMINMNCTLEVKGKEKSVKNTFNILYSKEVDNWGFSTFEHSDFVEHQSALLNSGILTIVCYLKLDDAKFQPVEITELDKLSENFETLFDCNIKCDVTFHVEDKEFPAHQSILATRSKVFASMFEHELSESKTGVVKIVDCHPDIFEIFLRYLYSGKAKDLTLQKVQQLYRVADKYGELKLKFSCVDFMKQHISADCVPSLLTLAQFYEEKSLLHFVQDFFNKNVVAVLSTKAWEELLKEDHLLANKLMKEMASTLKL